MCAVTARVLLPAALALWAVTFVLMGRGWADGDLHQIWNFVLACYECNSANNQWGNGRLVAGLRP